MDALAGHHRQLRLWAENCPENFENRAALVGAEIARLEGRDADAMRLYEQAIRSARMHGFVNNEALAYEVAARFYAARGFEEFARLYLHNARYSYLRWGAEGKVRQLEAMHPYLTVKDPASSSTSIFAAPVEHLDLATVIRVSQAVSSEIVPEKLIGALMRNAIAQAGAESGRLILLRGSETRMVAEATTRGDAIVVELRDASITPSVLPEMVLQHVLHTRESVILDDAATEPSFAADPYIRQRQGRSILCAPLINQGKLIGALYLENNLATGVFVPARIPVLKLLASQAAVSLEARESERRYREVQSELAHANRVATMGLLTVSIAHEVNQPIAASAMNANAGLRWLNAEPPNLDEATKAFRRVAENANRAGEVISRMRALIRKAPPRRDTVAINDAIREVVALTQGEAVKNGVSLRTQLAEGLPTIAGDLVQLQQVILNLIVNAIEAMSDADEAPRELVISTEEGAPDGVLVAVRDSGPGLASAILERPFEAFYTTKTSGLGMGLSICRSIVEDHGGRLWGEANEPRGAVFRFTLPTHRSS